jgi:hypothetical protein
VAEVRRFYRVTRSNPPSPRDFFSNVTKRRRPPAYDQETLRLWAGISMFDTLERAQERARHLPVMGAFIAEVQIPDNGPVYFEQTGTDPHHYTIWGDPMVLLDAVIMVILVDPSA